MQGIFGVKAEIVLRADAAFGDPLQVMLLRTEEIHDVSAASCPIICAGQVYMQHEQRFWLNLLQFTVPDLG